VPLDVAHAQRVPDIPDVALVISYSSPIGLQPQIAVYNNAEKLLLEKIGID
jgi:hypothetical protein